MELITRFVITGPKNTCCEDSKALIRSDRNVSLESESQLVK